MSFKYILKITCEDKKGIVASITSFITKIGGFIIESAQFGDEKSNRFFMRIVFSSDTDLMKDSFFKTNFAPIEQHFAIDYEIFPQAYRPKMLILVSKEGHCLHHLLYKIESGMLNANATIIASNHNSLEKIATWYNIPFVYLADKNKREEQILELIDRHKIDLTVLARYMQILTPQVSKKLYGKIINIHHSFLPSFKGAKPYEQAYDRGVKLIGATAHYVNEELDEGPIITQEVVAVNHSHNPQDLKQLGQDIESRVLFSAIQAHNEHRVFLNGKKTIVFK
jgi:formyltetrahydrofolate deformylase